MLEVSAPAKINLNLRILGKRPDGFHELETLITEVALHDRLTFTKRSHGVEFTCSRSDLETADNLVVRAVRLLERESGSTLPVGIHLEKRTPSGAGLGGGSSDAAATLKAVRQLYELPIGDQRLETLAADLGSDVPFFLRGGTAWCRGRGEQLESVELENPPANILLLRHSLEIPTPWAYQRWTASRELPEFPYAPQTQPWGEVVNDLERPAFEKFLILGMTKQWLLEQDEVAAACMTGSGSALFAILSSDEPSAREQLSEKARKHFGSDLWTH